MRGDEQKKLQLHTREGEKIGHDDEDEQMTDGRTGR